MPGAEEVLFRGALYRNCEAWLGTAPALAISAALFAASHLGNTGVTPIAVVSLVLGGVVAGLIYALTRTLWVPIGAHFGWNFMQAGVLGIAVSGHALHGVMHFALSGPDWAAGGSFGAEGTLAAVITLTLIALVLGAHVVRHRRWVRLRWQWMAPLAPALAPGIMIA